MEKVHSGGRAQERSVGTMDDAAVVDSGGVHAAVVHSPEAATALFIKPVRKRGKMLMLVHGY